MPATPECPRCGYDQSGAIATWDGLAPARCPTSGTCTECGLEFRWGEVLNPKLIGPEWCVEQRRFTIGRLVASVAMCFRPRRLWRELRLEHRVKPRRAAVIGLLAMLLAYGVLASINVGAWLAVEAAYSPANPFFPRTGPWTFWDRLHAQFGGVAAGLWPFKTQLYWSGSLGTIMDPFVAHALLMWLLVPVAFLALPETLRRARVRPRHLVRAWFYSLALLPMALFLWVALHVVRETFPASWASDPWSPTFPSSLLSEAGFRCALPLLVLLILWHWWSRVLREYLRLRETRRILLAMLTIAFLAAASAVLLVPAYNRSILHGWGV